MHCSEFWGIQWSGHGRRDGRVQRRNVTMSRQTPVRPAQRRNGNVALLSQALNHLQIKVNIKKTRVLEFAIGVCSRKHKQARHRPRVCLESDRFKTINLLYLSQWLHGPQWRDFLCQRQRGTAVVQIAPIPKRR
jgi:hypothetical protein